MNCRWLVEIVKKKSLNSTVNEGNQGWSLLNDSETLFCTQQRIWPGCGIQVQGDEFSNVSERVSKNREWNCIDTEALGIKL